MGEKRVPELNRRAVFGLGAMTTAGIVFGQASAASAKAPAKTPAGQAGAAESAPATVRQAAARVSRVYQAESGRAGGTWRSLITLADTDGTLVPAVQADPDVVVQAYSVNKIAVATAVLDKIDRGLLALDQRVDVTTEIVNPPSDGIFCLDQAYPSSVTLGHVIANMLTVSDDIAVRLCGLVCTSSEVNDILVAKGFPNTQVEPTANPHRMFLGETTPREMHNLLQGILKGTVLSAPSSDFLLGLIRSPIAFTDGIRRNMSSDERARIGTKAGWFDAARNEAGIIFDAAGAPVLTYSMFADGMADPDNFGATHPALQARAVMGRNFLDAVDKLRGTASIRARPAAKYRPSNGG
jgi:beta-lactamase class A